MAFQTPFLFREYKTWLDIFWNSSSSLSKINTSRPFKFSKNNCGHAIWLMAHFLKNVDLWLIYDSNVCNMHILWIRILWRFFSNANFRNPPTQNFKYRFSLKCVGVIFFRPHIRIQKNRVRSKADDPDESRRSWGAKAGDLLSQIGRSLSQSERSLREQTILILTKSRRSWSKRTILYVLWSKSRRSRKVAEYLP